jgi:hypothetical protein
MKLKTCLVERADSDLPKEISDHTVSSNVIEVGMKTRIVVRRV